MSPASAKADRGFFIVATAQPPKPQKLKAKLYQLRGLRVFAAGVARGQQWSEQDIDDMVANAETFGHLIRPPLVVGHEEKQSLTEGLASTGQQNTGEPSFGKVQNVRKEKGRDEKGQPVTYLTVDALDVPGWLAHLIAGKHYIDRSAEIYDEPPDGMEKAKGPILRRVALLGGELPQIKNLGEMPDPEVQQYAEVIRIRQRPLRYRGVTVRPRDHTKVVRFSECPTMAKFKKYADCSDATKAGMKKFADAATASPDATAAPDGVSREDMIGMLADYGVDASLLEGMTDEQLAEMLRVLSSQVPDEAPPEPKTELAEPAATAVTATPAAAPTSTGPAPANPSVSPSGMGHPTSVTMKYSEKQIADMNAKADALEQRLAALDKITADRIGDEKRTGFKAFCEAQVKAGRLLPAWIDAGLEEVAMELDAVKVHKFSDGKEVTPLDKLKKIIAAGPNLLVFSERLANGKSGEDGADHEEGRVKQHYHRFSESFKKQGLTEEKLVAGFKALKARLPESRAEDYLGAGVA